MMTSSSTVESNSLIRLATYLATRREALFINWQMACKVEPALKGVARLSRQEFTSNVPLMLTMLEQRLLGQDQEVQVSLLAADHGLHRWQKGYTLAELSMEMQYLGRLLLEELRVFWQLYPSTDSRLMTSVYEHFAAFNNQISTGSVGQYAELHRIAASSRVEALEKALAELNEASLQRNELLRHSSHDLRGGFGAIEGAASLLEMGIESEQERKQMLEMLLRNLTNCRLLVTQLMDLARLEAGQESLNIQPVDAGLLLTNLVVGYQPLANKNGLLLKADGPASLVVECDPVHLQRIIQNLVLNALKYTPTGWVAVFWTRENEDYWLVSIQDSGPGLPTKAGWCAQTVGPTAHVSGLCSPHKGEGLGLSIVKGLCELLRANLEIESKPGEGTLFRIRLAIRWQP
ncbi:sensor histidine kinase [Larkinella bovis]|uniref:histidine kinase n=1 Tax=Larkinella bovis TaxID=683041 RepID=A0ABW0IBJ6_9BACT